MQAVWECDARQFARAAGGDDVGELEEDRLHDHVDPAAEAHFLRHLHRVDVVELELLARDLALHGRGQMLFHVLQGPVGVEDKGGAVLDALEQVVLGDIGLLVAGDVVGLGDEVGGGDDRNDFFTGGAVK